MLKKNLAVLYTDPRPDETGPGKITDFGFSTKITCYPAILQATQCATPECLALEVILGHGVETVALCLLAGCYGHAGDLLRLIGEHVAWMISFPVLYRARKSLALTPFKLSLNSNFKLCDLKS